MTPFVFRNIALPEDTQRSIDLYLEQGVPTGDFLRAVIDNNLRDALNRADETHMGALPAVVAYLHKRAQMRAWGQAGSFERWIVLKQKERTEARNAD